MNVFVISLKLLEIFGYMSFGMAYHISVCLHNTSLHWWTGCISFT